MAKDMKKFQSEVSNRIQTLQTKAGADQFIAERKAAYANCRTEGLSESLRRQIEHLRVLVDRDPARLVNLEIRGLQMEVDLMNGAGR